MARYKTDIISWSCGLSSVISGLCVRNSMNCARQTVSRVLLFAFPGPHPHPCHDDEPKPPQSPCKLFNYYYYLPNIRPVECSISCSSSPVSCPAKYVFPDHNKLPSTRHAAAHRLWLWWLLLSMMMMIHPRTID